MTRWSGTEPLLTVRSLHAGYGRHTVVRDLSMEARRGEITALLGPNGSGKTTTLLTIAGLLNPIGGEVRVLGAPVASKSPHRMVRRGLSFVPDDRALFRSLTTAENLKAIGTSPATLEMALEYFPSLRARLNVKAGALSGGEQQMLAIARGLVSRPKVLLVDELSMGLAPLIVATVLGVLRRVADETGTAIVLVEQHVRQVLAVADHAVVLVHGSVQLTGPSAELREQPERLANAYLGPVRQPVGATNP